MMLQMLLIRSVLLLLLTFMIPTLLATATIITPPQTSPSPLAVQMMLGCYIPDHIVSDDDCHFDFSEAMVEVNKSFLRSRRTQKVSVLNKDVDLDEDKLFGILLKYWMYGLVIIFLILCFCMFRFCCILYCPCSSRRRQNKNKKNNKETVLQAAFAEDYKNKNTSKKNTPPAVLPLTTKDDNRNMKDKKKNDKQQNNANDNNNCKTEENNIAKPWSTTPSWIFLGSEK